MRMSNTTFQPRKSARATLTHVICVTENIAEKGVGVSRHLFHQASLRQSHKALVPSGTPIANRHGGKIKFTRPRVSTRERTGVESAMMPG
jgi:hypothetical protein